MTLKEILEFTPHDSDPSICDYRTSYILLSLLSHFAELVIPALVLAAAAYQCLWHTGYTDLSVPQFAWNVLVYITPYRLINVFEDEKTPSKPDIQTRTFAKKSEAMRRILRLDSSFSMLDSVSQAGRRMSSIPVLDKMAEVGKRKLSMLPGITIGGGVDGRPPGLGNWDNSCYQNSVLQGLASLEHLPGYLQSAVKHSLDTSKQQASSLEMSKSLYDLMRQLNDPKNNGKRIWTPATLKSMSSWQQQDAQEYYSKVLDEVDKEISKVVVQTSALPGLASSKRRSSTDSEVHVDEGDINSNRPFITPNPLEGLIAQRVGCTKCGYSEGLSMIPFNCLTLPLGKAWSYDLSECLDESTKLETIEGVECGKCTLFKTQRLLRTLLERVKDESTESHVRQSTLARLNVVNQALEEDDYDEKTLSGPCKIPSTNRVATTKSRQAVVARPPKSLAIHINRSLFDEMTGELKKNYADVKFPLILDIGCWCLGSADKGHEPGVESWRLDPEKSLIASSTGKPLLQGPLYELRAVVTHYGRHENGHYICYRKHSVPTETQEHGEVQPKKQWWRLSDDDVSLVPESTVLAQGGVFMLFYDRIGSVSHGGSPSDPNIMPCKSDQGATPASLHDQFASFKEDELDSAAQVSLPIGSDDSSENIVGSDNQSLFMNREQKVATSISELGADEKVATFHQDLASHSRDSLGSAHDFNENNTTSLVRDYGRPLMV